MPLYEYQSIPVNLYLMLFKKNSDAIPLNHQPTQGIYRNLHQRHYSDNSADHSLFFWGCWRGCQNDLRVHRLLRWCMSPVEQRWCSAPRHKWSRKIYSCVQNTSLTTLLLFKSNNINLTLYICFSFKSMHFVSTICIFDVKHTEFTTA